ncbi:MAG: PEP/pyruvate-binding domain-containing protein, partial [Trebonia sp.]
MTPASLVVPLADASSAAEAGGKGASLGFLARAGVAVPPGFVVTAGAFAAVMSALD